MIDIHSHIVFDVDDGPKNRADSKALLEEAYAQGVRTIVSTSHRRKGMFETPEDKIAANFSEVKQLAQEIATGFEYRVRSCRFIFLVIALEKLEKDLIPRLNDTRFALIEFSMNTPYRDIHSALTKVLMLGITPVVAHIERYHTLETMRKK